MSRAQVTSTVEQNTGGAVAPFVAGKNKIINGDFGIWQRGTSINLTASVPTFLADRFSAYMDSNAGTVTYSRQTFTPGTAPVAGYEGQYFARITTGGNCNLSFSNFLEDVRTLAGQVVTISWWAKASTTKTFYTLLRQSFGTGGSADVNQSNTWTATTTWQRFTFTYVLPSISGKTIGTGSYLLLQLIQYGSSTGNYDIDIWGVQLEAGSVATPFTTATGTLSGELAACQRYYQRFTSTATTGTIIPIGLAYSSTGLIFQQPLLVSMRTSPTVIDYANVRGNDTNTPYTLGAITIDANNGSPTMAYLASTTTGLTTYRPIYATGNGTVGYIGISAEL